jgi:hypothetical protein
MYRQPIISADDIHGMPPDEWLDAALADAVPLGQLAMASRSIVAMYLVAMYSK